MSRSKRIAWGITGSGDYLGEVLSLMKVYSRTYNLEIHVYLSAQAEVVLRFYKFLDDLKASFPKVVLEKGPNNPFLTGKLQLGTYRLFLIAPATANTVAKIAHGIADSLISNSAAQAMKVDVPVYIFPVDQREGKIITKLPDGRDLTLRIRKEDVENVEKLKRMQGITVLSQVAEIEDVVRRYANS